MGLFRLNVRLNSVTVNRLIGEPFGRSFLLQREPLSFHLDTSALAPHLVDLVLEIQRIAESTLFHWRTFPLNLPQPIAVQEFSEGSASTRRKPLIVDNLFNVPSWDDLDVVSVDAHGEAKRLSSKQLTSVRQQG